MLTDRQTNTDRQTDRNTPLPCRDGVINHLDFIKLDMLANRQTNWSQYAAPLPRWSNEPFGFHQTRYARRQTDKHRQTDKLITIRRSLPGRSNKPFGFHQTRYFPSSHFRFGICGHCVHLWILCTYLQQTEQQTRTCHRQFGLTEPATLPLQLRLLLLMADAQSNWTGRQQLMMMRTMNRAAAAIASESHVDTWRPPAVQEVFGQGSLRNATECARTEVARHRAARGRHSQMHRVLS